jgi:phosphoribosyl 1,2-cyclic phosphodiesterase
MKVTCWGSRGSIPVSGAEYVKYGGDTTCMEITSTSGDVIIIDAGTGMRRLGNKLLAEGKRNYSVLLTHAHWDHLMGFPFFKPIYLKGTKISLYGCAYVQESVKQMISQAMVAPYFPVDYGQLAAEFDYHNVCEKGFSLGQVQVTSIQLSHPNQGLGYRFSENGKSFVFLTDNELTVRHAGGEGYDEYLRFSEGCDLLIHDAEYTQEQYQLTKGWGHSVYTDALRLARETGAKQFGLFHINQERTDQDMDRIVDECNRIVKEEGSGPRCFGTAAGMTIEL